MIINDLKKCILENGFVDEVRQEMRFNGEEYRRLIDSLERLSKLMKSESSLDKDLAFYLYLIPQMIRNAFLSFEGESRKSEMASKLEDAWVEIDALVIDCLN